MRNVAPRGLPQSARGGQLLPRGGALGLKP